MPVPTLHRSRDGRMLCSGHSYSGAPAYHSPGCEACEHARAKGIVRPDIDSVPKKQRGRRRHLEDNVDWSKIPKEHRGAMAFAISTRKMGS